MRRRFTVLVLCALALVLSEFIILFPEVENQALSQQFHCGPCKITVKIGSKRAEIQEEGWTPGIRRTGWWDWKP